MDLAGLVGKIHGLVWVILVIQHIEVDEVGFLPFDLLAGVGAAVLAG